MQGKSCFMTWKMMSQARTYNNIHFCYESSNRSCPKHDYSATVRAPLYVLLGAVIFLIVLGNLLVIIIITYFKQLHTPTNYLVLSLAVADFLLGAVIMPPSMVRSLETCWYLGNICILVQNRMSIVIFSLLVFFIPAFIIIVLYMKILLVARRQAFSIQSRVCANMSLEKRATLNKTQPKATKTLGIVVGVYFICWGPWFLCTLIDPIIPFFSPLLTEILTWFAYCNSVTNPVIYAFSFTWFQKPFKRAVIIVTVFGNLLVIIAIVHLKQLHTPTNYLVLSLAMADFLVGVVIMPPSMVRSLETCWYLGNLFCKIHTSTDFTLCNASILHLSLISIDRYYAVCNPLQYQTRITTSAVVTMIMISWILSAVFGFGMIFLQLNILGLEDIYYQQFYCEGGCFVIQSKIASSVSSVLSFYNPGFIILSIYLKIFLIARRQVYSIQKSACLKRNSARAGDFSSKSEQKATKTLGIVVGVFLCCWTPFFVCNTFFMFVSMGIAVLLTVSGNLLVIMAISHFKQLHTSTNGLILSLAVCDFLLGALIMPCSAMRSVHGCWFLGDLACKLHTSTDIMLSTSSIFHLSFISVDRYFAVCTPLAYRSTMNSTTTFVMAAISWLVPAIFAFGMIFSELNLKGSKAFYDTNVRCHGGCPVFFSQASAAFASMFSFFIPGLIMFGIYMKIYKVARSQARSIKGQTQQFR
ncbi:trace amine-associated receptor 1-like, partial [Scleropages formosus]